VWFSLSSSGLGRPGHQPLEVGERVLAGLGPRHQVVEVANAQAADLVLGDLVRHTCARVRLLNVHIPSSH
jgi:hypothetical protein